MAGRRYKAGCRVAWGVWLCSGRCINTRANKYAMRCDIFNAANKGSSNNNANQLTKALAAWPHCHAASPISSSGPGRHHDRVWSDADAVCCAGKHDYDESKAPHTRNTQEDQQGAAVATVEVVGGAGRDFMCLWRVNVSLFAG